MDNGKLSVRYARALLNTALELHCEDEVYEGMVRLSNNYSLAINAFNEALSNPMNSDDDKVRLLMTAIGEPVHPNIEHFLRFMAEKKRINKIFLTALKYQEMYRKAKNILRAKVTTAAEMDEPTKEKMRDFMAKTFGCQIEMHTDVDPSLIGGFTVDIEHDRMDASIAGRLEALRKQLNN
ncbi:MAG: F0F1 ATP synthase subunit delta [Bacteroidales bacterium]|nr:F0F1 ATP synthase subunit delta [Bacteroidales bacterium]